MQIERYRYKHYIVQCENLIADENTNHMHYIMQGENLTAVTVQGFQVIYNLCAGETRQVTEFSTELDQLRTTSEKEISQLTEKLESMTADRDRLNSEFYVCEDDTCTHYLTIMGISVE